MRNKIYIVPLEAVYAAGGILLATKLALTTLEVEFPCLSFRGLIAEPSVFRHLQSRAPVPRTGQAHRPHSYTARFFLRPVSGASLHSSHNFAIVQTV